MNTSSVNYLTLTNLLPEIDRQVQNALAEDIGNLDLTAALIPKQQNAKATIISREHAVICGIPWVNACFKLAAPASQIEWLVNEGDTVSANQILCNINGNAREILSTERCSLNFLQTLSATATITKKYVDAVQGTNAAIMDTRKTIPGMRVAQKYAVTIGGGLNQRMGLYDGILIKENHIAAAGGIAQAMQAAFDIGGDFPIQIEVENLDELDQALKAGAKLILLDNFDTETLLAAVKLNKNAAILEASGGITIDNIREIALTGVDRISIGSLTKNIQAIDLSMRFSS